MSKEGIIELQKLDCNCNDCGFLVRDFHRYNQSVEQHRKWQQDYFNTIKNNLLAKAAWWQNKINVNYNFEKGERVRKEANKLRFEFTKKGISINYGQCSKLNKDISFIPSILQLETQECFVHRKDL
jgi:hypothetical protein